MTTENIRAKVEDVEITQDDVQNFINMLSPEARIQFSNEEGFNKITDELVNQELLYLDALDKKLDQDPAYAKEVEMAKINILKQFALANLFKDLNVTDEELNEYYENHKQHFTRPMQINASHILVDSEEDAKKIKARIEEGESFEDLAKELSNCPSKEAGGNLGTFSPGQMVKEFDEVCQEIEIGTLSDPVKTQFGYHIIKVNDRKEPSIITFEEAKEDMLKQYTAIKQQELYLNKTIELQKDYKVEKFY